MRLSSENVEYCDECCVYERFWQAMADPELIGPG